MFGVYKKHFFFGSSLVDPSSGEGRSDEGHKVGLVLVAMLPQCNPIDRSISDLTVACGLAFDTDTVGFPSHSEAMRSRSVLPLPPSHSLSKPRKEKASAVACSKCS